MSFIRSFDCTCLDVSPPAEWRAQVMLACSSDVRAHHTFSRMESLSYSASREQGLHIQGAALVSCLHWWVIASCCAISGATARWERAGHVNPREAPGWIQLPRVLASLDKLWIYWTSVFSLKRQDVIIWIWRWECIWKFLACGKYLISLPSGFFSLSLVKSVSVGATSTFKVKKATSWLLLLWPSIRRLLAKKYHELSFACQHCVFTDSCSG